MGVMHSTSQSASAAQGKLTAKASRFEQNRTKALELFATKGFGQVSLRELATHLGLTAGSLYHHCSGKEELLFEFIEEHYEGLFAAFSRAPLHTAPTDWLRELIAASIELHGRQPLHFQLAAKERHCLSPVHRQRIDELHLRCQERLLRGAGIDSDVSPALRKAAGAALSRVFEQIPNWLEPCELPEAERLALLESLIRGAVSQLLSYLKTYPLVHQQGNHHAAILRPLT